MCACVYLGGVSRVMRCSGEAKFTQKVTRRTKVCYAFGHLFIIACTHTQTHAQTHTHRDSMARTFVHPPAVRSDLKLLLALWSAHFWTGFGAS